MMPFLIAEKRNNLKTLKFNLMKKIAFVILAFFCSFTAKSQTVDVIDSLFMSPGDQFNYMMSNIDLSGITSGCLDDKAFHFGNAKAYNGQLSVNNLANGFEFGKMYATITSMAIAPNYELPHPSVYTNGGDVNNSGIIDIIGIHYNYQKLKDNVISDGLLTSDGEKFFEGPNYGSEGLFDDKEVFLITPKETAYEGLSVNFKFNSNLFFANTNKVIDEINIDFADGNGPRQVVADQLVPVEYPEAGKKVIQFSIEYTDGTIYYAHASIMMKESNQTREYFDEADITTVTIVSTETYEGQSASAEVTTFLACGHENLQKPLIWVEGFDPTNILDGNYMLGILLDGSYQGNTLFRLQEEGYDLVYVNFNNNTAGFKEML